MTAEQSAGTPGPRWRARLEARWQAYVQEVTELSLLLPAWQIDALERAAQAEGITVAHLLRRVINRALTQSIVCAASRSRAARLVALRRCSAPPPVR